MSELATVKSLTKAARITTKTVVAAVQHNRRTRAEEFLKLVDARYETLTAENQQRLIGYVQSSIGQEILADYAETSIRTQSSRVRMALALLFCSDSDTDFSEDEKRLFIGSVSEISDNSVDFFLLLPSLPQYDTRILFPYTRYVIDEKLADKHIGDAWSTDRIFWNIHDLIRRGLLSPDPQTHVAQHSWGQEWSVFFGISEVNSKMIQLLKKAELLLASDT